jgi:hypothetical protein
MKYFKRSSWKKGKGAILLFNKQLKVSIYKKIIFFSSSDILWNNLYYDANVFPRGEKLAMLGPTYCQNGT